MVKLDFCSGFDDHFQWFRFLQWFRAASAGKSVGGGEEHDKKDGRLMERWWGRTELRR